MRYGNYSPAGHAIRFRLRYSEIVQAKFHRIVITSFFSSYRFFTLRHRARPPNVIPHLMRDPGNKTAVRHWRTHIINLGSGLRIRAPGMTP